MNYDIILRYINDSKTLLFSEFQLIQSYKIQLECEDSIRKIFNIEI